MSASSTDICGIDVQALYLNDPGNKQEPVGYVLFCVVLQQGANCVTSGDDYITCAVASGSAGSKESQNESSVTSSTTTKANTESNTPSSKTSNSTASGSDDVVSVSSTAASSHSMSTTVMIVIIVVAVVFVALVSWVVRSYCMRRSAAENKLAHQLQVVVEVEEEDEIPLVHANQILDVDEETRTLMRNLHPVEHVLLVVNQVLLVDDGIKRLTLHLPH
ncbi:Hypothetical protein PHPALM_10096 [Phytophthora palmivora]|uniref:Uncharacterized protein n=1 Tax=Phytophthora palmivora TaxID=4796 RepID=A0A2P4Y5J7_9STRA|nr:Hypothetical protein PHPALM_10096 [Phytophthora palmivora]